MSEREQAVRAVRGAVDEWAAAHWPFEDSAGRAFSVAYFEALVGGVVGHLESVGLLKTVENSVEPAKTAAAQ